MSGTPENQAASSAPHENAAGDANIRVLGDFELREIIGVGGMGTVYRAWQRSLQRVVALKVLDQRTSSSPIAVARFKREAQAAAKLHHMYIVPVYAQDEDDGTYFYAMELVEGDTLADIIKHESGQTTEDTGTSALDETVLLPPRGSATGAASSGSSGPKSSSVTNSVSAASMARGSGVQLALSDLPTDPAFYENVARDMANIADALAYAHDNGVVHRDIKPHNLLVGSDGRMRVSDFGLARLAEQPGVTMTGEVVGSPLYMSREQLSGELDGVDHRTDIYSLGATMYEWLTLRPPYPGETRERVIALILTGEADPVRAHNPNVPVDLETICMRAINQNRTHRYQSAGAMRDDLRRYLENQPIRARRDSTATRILKFIMRHQVVSLATAAVVVLAVVLFVLHNTNSTVREQTAELADAQHENAQLRDLLSAIPLARTLTPSIEQAIEGLIDTNSSTGQKPSDTTADDNAGVGTPQSIARGILNQFYTSVVPRNWPPTGQGTDAKSRLLIRAVELWQEGNLTTALDLVEAYQQDHPTDALAIQLHAALKTSTGNYADVVRDADRMIELDETSANARIWYGLASLMLGRIEDAIDSLSLATQLDADSAWANVTRGLAMIVDGREFGAIQEFEDALRRTQDFAPAILGIASAYKAVGRFDDALPQATRVLRLEPENADALSIRGDCYIALGDFASAIADFDAAMAIVGEDSGLKVRTWLAKLQQLKRRNQPSPATRDAAGAAEVGSAFPSDLFDRFRPEPTRNRHAVQGARSRVALVRSPW